MAQAGFLQNPFHIVAIRDEGVFNFLVGREKYPSSADADRTTAVSVSVSRKEGRSRILTGREKYLAIGEAQTG